MSHKLSLDTNQNKMKFMNQLQGLCFPAEMNGNKNKHGVKK